MHHAKNRGSDGGGSCVSVLVNWVNQDWGGGSLDGHNKSFAIWSEGNLSRSSVRNGGVCEGLVKTTIGTSNYGKSSWIISVATKYIANSTGYDASNIIVSGHRKGPVASSSSRDSHQTNLSWVLWVDWEQGKSVTQRVHNKNVGPIGEHRILALNASTISACAHAAHKGNVPRWIPGKNIQNVRAANGECVNGSCLCYPGFSGPSCAKQMKFCPKGCAGRGKCLTGGMCSYFSGWSGLDCTTKYFSPTHQLVQQSEQISSKIIPTKQRELEELPAKLPRKH